MLPINILLVDDRPENLLALTAVLKHPRYSLVPASSGWEAITLLAQREFAVILLDVQMPAMDGFETAHKIKSDARFRCIPIIFITAMSDDPQQVFRGYDSGAIDYLMKPFDEHLLKSKVSVLADLYEKSAELKKEIRERERADAALRRIHLELEQRVKDRTASLEASLREKEVLLKEIHHRVKNNLQIISSLLSLQSDGISDPQMSGLFRESQNRIRSMALVHEELYGTKELSTIEMASYVRNLTSQLLLSMGRLDVEVQMETGGISLNLNTAIPCGLILNELVSNALKHAFPNSRPGRVGITLKRLPDNMITLQVSDNGIGVKELDVSSAESLGLRLVSLLARQLGGTFHLEPSNGTCFVLVFPDPDTSGREPAHPSTLPLSLRVTA